MINISCAICGKKQKTKILYSANFSPFEVTSQIFSARRIPDKMHYQINQCLNCGLIFSSPVFPLNKIKKLYQESKFSYEEQVPYLNKTYLYYLKKYLKKISSFLKLLDVGCGNGFFLNEVYKMGIKETYGVEPSREAVLKAPKNIKNKIKIDILKEGLFKNSFFDVITCFQTFDHVFKPNEFLKIIYGILKKEGFVFFVLHDTQGLSVKLFGERSPIFDIEHIYLFNQETIRKIFEINGFKNIKVFKIKNNYPLTYWLKMSPLPSLIKNLFLFFLQKSKLGQLTIALNAGNLGVVASK